MSTFHTELSSPDDLVVSYDINTLDGLSALEENVHQYQPQFLQLRPVRKSRYRTRCGSHGPTCVKRPPE